MRRIRLPADPLPGVKLAAELPGRMMVKLHLADAAMIRRALQRQADSAEAHGIAAAPYAATLRRIAADLAARGTP